MFAFKFFHTVDVTLGKPGILNGVKRFQSELVRREKQMLRWTMTLEALHAWWVGTPS